MKFKNILSIWHFDDIIAIFVEIFEKRIWDELLLLVPEVLLR